MLKKKRVNVSDPDCVAAIMLIANYTPIQQWENVSYTEKWDAINLTLAPFNPEERDEREEATAEVLDPLYMFTRIDADAEGEVDETVPAEETQASMDKSAALAEVFGDD